MKFARNIDTQILHRTIPYYFCTDVTEKASPNDPCSPSPCGPGAICRTRGTGASCECEPGLRGDPYSGCRPECLSDSDCAPSRACMRSHCRDPCQGTCGINAECETINHIPLCSCPEGTRGNAFERCDLIMQGKIGIATTNSIFTIR